jgi:lysophospholipase L1-like esterase
MKKLLLCTMAIAVCQLGCASSDPGTGISGSGGNVVTGQGGGAGARATSTGGSTSAGAVGGTVGVGGTGAGGLVATGGSAGGRGGAGGQFGSGGNVGSGGASGGSAGSATGGSSAAGGAGSGGVAAGGDGGRGGAGGASDAGSDARDAGTPDLNPDVASTDLAVDRARSDVGATGNVTVYIAGDSTVSTYTNSSIHQGGWGQFLQTYFLSNAKIVNKAVGGMTARHFIEAGYLDDIVAALKAGDYLLVQFGTNDGNKTATYTLPGSSTAIPYYLDPATDFKTYLAKYVNATKSKSATTIFVTPPPRHSCDAGETGVRNGLAAYATAMQELGPTLGTPVVDLNAMTIAYLANVTCETSGKTFYLVKADGSIDSTHFQENGANIMAGLIAKGSVGIGSLDIPLAAYVK